MTSTLFRASLLAGAIATLAACGGDSDSTPAAPATQTGVLTDSPIGGVSYTTSPSGKRGVTDADGHYDFVAGDTVTFRVGSVTLGTVTATGTITPLELADDGDETTDDSNVVKNLLVFFQSLDVDGDASNGITIVEEAVAAATAEIDFNVDPAVFVASDDLSDLVAATNTAEGATAAVVAVEDALAHFEAQLLASLAGTWIWDDNYDTYSTYILRIDADGNYTIGGADGEEQGIEVGSFDIDGATGEVTNIVATIDTIWGIADTDARYWLSVKGGQLELHEVSTEETLDTLFDRLSPAASGFEGFWGVGSASSFDTQQVAFLSGNRYLLIDPVGDELCGQPGVEFGSWSTSGSTLTFSNVTADTNGCGGMHDNDVYSEFGFALDSEAGTLALTEGEDTFTLLRAD